MSTVDDACSECFNGSSVTDVLRHVLQLPATGSHSLLCSVVYIIDY